MINKTFQQKLAILLSLAISMPTTMVYGVVSQDDISQHWASGSIQKMVNKGVVSGYEDGTFRPNNPLTRAEFAAFLQKLFRFESVGGGKLYDDVVPTAWYSESVNNVVARGLMHDEGPLFVPEQYVTREEAAYALTAAYQLERGTVIQVFEDASSVTAWAEEAVATMVSNGYFVGDTYNRLHPDQAITRAEMMSLLDRMTETLFTEQGTYEGGQFKGNVLINTQGVSLKNCIIAGNLYLTSGIGSGTTTLDHVEVSGKIIVDGGGVNGLRLEGCTLTEMVVEREQVGIAFDETTQVETVRVAAEGVVLDGVSHTLQLEAGVESVIVNGAVVTPATLDAFNAAQQPDVERDPVSHDTDSDDEDSDTDSDNDNGNGNNDGAGTDTDTDTDKEDEQGDVDEDVWTLVWQDEFEGEVVDTHKWAFQTGTQAEGGPANWGNQELQYYTEDNARIEEGQLIITAEREEKGGMAYTSARLWTEPTFTTTFGRVEAKMTLPEGQGLWPAFWMLPKDSPYGGWAAGGEIDIMEARGREIDSVDGTIHYGGSWPNNVYQGSSYTFPDGEDYTTDHVYAVEWEPGEIRWYVDDVQYHTENDWYAIDGMDPVAYTYPAPFDQPFYILLNLAVGGTYDGGIAPDETVEMPAEMKVDYVRVYESVDPYEEAVKPDITVDDYLEGSRTPVDGNFVLDPMIQEVIQNPTTLRTDVWNCAVTEGGAATAQPLDEGAKIVISNGGSQNYSVQMIDHIPLAKGRMYQLSFQAKADAARSITAQFAAGSERNWEKYSTAWSSNLGDEWQNYTYAFQMTGDTHQAARIEFNMGQSTTAVYLKDVVIQEVDKLYEEHGPKTPLENGNHVYNATFDKGEASKVFWSFVENEAVSGEVNKAKQAALQSTQETLTTALRQYGMQLLQGDTYRITFDAEADKASQVGVLLTSKDGHTTYMEHILDVTTYDDTYTTSFTMPMNITDEEAVLSFQVKGVDNTTYLDNIYLERLTNENVDLDSMHFYPLSNGNFSLGYDGWEALAVEGGGATFSIEGDDKIAVIDINTLGPNPWNVMLNNNALAFTKGLTYTVMFDAWADQPRDMEVVLEAPGYVRLFDEQQQLTQERQTFTYTFTMTTEDLLNLKYFLGNTVSPALGKVYIDNIRIEAENAPLKAPVVLIPDDTDNQVGQSVTIRHEGDAAWLGAITAVTIGKEVVDRSDYTLDEQCLVLDAGVFEEEGIHTIAIEATGYSDSQVKQTMIASDGNLIRNGDYRNGLEEWTFWTMQADHSNVEIVDEEAVIQINYNGGVTTEWGDPVPIAWNTQLKQENIELEAGKRYVLRFDAQSSLARPIKVELVNAVEGGAVIVEIDETRQTYEIVLTPTVALNNFCVNMLLGNVVDGDRITPEAPHQITLDNVSIVEEKAPVLEQVAMPTIVLEDGRVLEASQSINITTQQSLMITTSSGLNVYYTTQVHADKDAFELYEGQEIVIIQTMTLRAFVTKEGMADSEILEVSFLLN